VGELNTAFDQAEAAQEELHATVRTVDTKATANKEGLRVLSERLVEVAEDVAIISNHTLAECTVRVFDSNLHSRMPLDPTHVRLKRTRV
jgi:hypothetical protein